MAKEKRNLEDRLGDINAQLIIVWPLLIINFVMLFYVYQRAGDEDLNLLSIAITLFEAFLLIALAAGFWMVRREAVSRAEDVAAEIAEECAAREARKLAEEMIPPQPLRQIMTLLEIAPNQGLDDDQINDIMTKLDK